MKVLQGGSDMFIFLFIIFPYFYFLFICCTWILKREPTLPGGFIGVPVPVLHHRKGFKTPGSQDVRVMTFLDSSGLLYCL